MSEKVIYIKTPSLSKNEKIVNSYIIHNSQTTYKIISSEEILLNEVKALCLTSAFDQQILVVSDYLSDYSNFSFVLKAKNLNLNEDLEWVKHPYLEKGSSFLSSNIYSSWNKFNLIQEDKSIKQNGLREPQIGAIYRVLSHWTISKEKGLVVLPTGTGKTEVMLSLFVKEKLRKLLVVVPSDPLREQLGIKFLKLGLLKNPKFRILNRNAQTPVVGFLGHIFSNTEDIDKFCKKTDVIVSTSKAISDLPVKLRSYFLDKLSHLFIDEAHHVPSKTWTEIVNLFEKKPILLFTATPYREDKKLIEGKLLYQYPLKLAQENDYFKKINFKPFYEWDKSKVDERLAEEGIKQLRQDIKDGCDHILMARCYPNSQANEVYKIYKKYSEFNPVLIHSGVDNKQEVRKKILSNEPDKPRIIVCVDMLGEGFDLPELKIGVFHYIRKSLTPTLQLVGRFTRYKLDTKLGDATFIANLADQNVSKEIESLYRLDSDWDHLINDLNDDKSEQQKDFWDFLNGYISFPDNIPLQLLSPNMSTLIYKTNNHSINLDNFEEGLSFLGYYDEIKFDYNRKAESLVIVTGQKTSIDWGKIGDIYDIRWDLIVIFWDKKNKVISISSSNTKSKYEDFIRFFADDAKLLTGENLFRCFHGMNLIKLNRVGLRDINGKQTTYRQSMGSDVEPTLNSITQKGSTKVDIFGKGYENGELTTIGCSEKGRIWAFRDANLFELKNWIQSVTEKVLDNSIIPNEIFLKYTCITKTIKNRPNVFPISIDWNEDVYNYSSKHNIKVNIDGEDFYLYEIELELFKPSDNDDIIFQLITINDYKVQYKLIINSDGFEIKKLSTKNVIFYKGRNQKPFDVYLTDNPPIIRFIDGSELSSGNQYVELNFKGHSYDKSKFVVWDWHNINIKKEAQGVEKDKTSVQFKVIEKLKALNAYDIIFNDDGPGESADVVAISRNINEREIKVQLYHCKFSSESFAGGRISDIDVLCGQAQKSIKYVKKPSDLFSHLLHRKPYKNKDKSIDRIEYGKKETLEQIYEMSRSEFTTSFEIFVVQPGVSASKVSDDQLSLFGVTENYLHNTYQIPFYSIVNN